MSASSWPGSPAAEQVNLMTTVGIYALYLVVVVALIAAVLVLVQMGQRSASEHSFIDNHLPENEDVSVEASAVRASMLRKAADR